LSPENIADWEAQSAMPNQVSGATSSGGIMAC
jgi:hypothetical protein